MGDVGGGFGGGDPGGYGGGDPTDSGNPDNPGYGGGLGGGLGGDVGGDVGGDGNSFGPNPPPPPGADLSESPLAPFLKALNQYNPQFLNAGYTGLGQGTVDTTNLANTGISTNLGGLSTQLGGLSTQLGGLTPAGLEQAQTQTAGIAQKLQGIGEGTADPRFEAYRQSQLGLLETQKQGELGRASESLSRRGYGGSAAEQNAAAAINANYNQQGKSLSSQLGLESLGRQDAALQNAIGAYGQSANLGLSGTQLQSSLIGQRAGLAGQQAGIYGQQAGLNQQNFGNTLAQIESANQARGSNLEALTAGLQNMTLPYALETARVAAQNAGESGDGGKK